MKASIVTYHNSYSYGACLQAAATFELFRLRGFDTTFVDYHNPTEDDSLGKRAWSFLASGDLRRFVSVGLRNLIGYRRYALQGFSHFHEMLPKTPLRARSVDELQSLCTDILVIGSDQMWNPIISGSLDPVFFLQFGKAIKRISLATSMGNHSFTPEEQENVRDYLKSFAAVSVREGHAQQQVFEATGLNPFICLDPTLMVEPDYWRAFSSRPKAVGSDERYILVFTVNNRPQQASGLWRAASKKLGLPVYRIAGNTLPVSYIDKTLRGVTPQEFVWLIDNASYVYTDSFHGTAFSLALETPFTVFPNKTGNNVRMIELLDACSLPDRFVQLDSGEASCKPSVDFASSTDFLVKRRAECLAWLDSACADW